MTRVILLDFWDDNNRSWKDLSEMSNWLKSNIGPYGQNWAWSNITNGIQFEHDEDAVLFKLRFCV